MGPSTIMLVTREGLGHVDSEDKAFGVQMIERFLHTLESRPMKPQAICFYTEGVKLVCEGSPAILSLQLLQGMGVRLIACKTCLEHYGLTARVAVGVIGGMNDIVGLMMEAAKVVTL